MCCISRWVISVTEFYNLFCVLFVQFVIFCIQCGILQFNLIYSIVLRKKQNDVQHRKSAMEQVIQV